jgi:hypothetical protein
VEQEKFPATAQTFSDFFVKMVRSGRLSNDRIEALNKTFFASDAPK